MFLKRSHKNVNTVIRLVNPVSDRIMYISKVTVFIKWLNMNRMPYVILRSAYPTYRTHTYT